MDLICATEVPTPKGHYSHAVVSNGLLFVSGVLPDALATGVEDTFERQVRCVFERCEQILRAGNSSLSQVVQCTVYISDVALWASFNEIYASIFGSHKPARAVVPVPALHYGFKVEVQVVAEVGRP
jgi:reactive intermediate/imine deaminase